MAITTLIRPEQKIEPLRWMRQMTREMERMFGDMGLRPFEFDSRLASMTWAPEMEVFERNGRFIVRADLPGMKREDVKVNVQENMLIIEGERKVEEDVKKDNFHRTERMYGTFFRSLPLPDGVKLDKIDATFKEGVLEIAMPIEEAKKPVKNVEVKIA